VVAGVRANRAFLRRAVTYLTSQGVTQFVDIGSGLPTSQNVHQVAQELNPLARVCYVDNDPVVLAHARALLSADERTAVAQGDVRDPAGILGNPMLRRHLDFSKPIAVLFVAILHFLPEAADPAAAVRAFRDAVAPGSYVVISHVVPVTGEEAAGMREAVGAYQLSTSTFVPRPQEVLSTFFDGFDLIPPGLVPVHLWQPPRKAGRPAQGVPMVAGIGQVPLV
jgi:hypothetical protein